MAKHTEQLHFQKEIDETFDNNRNSVVSVTASRRTESRIDDIDNNNVTEIITQEVIKLKTEGQSTSDRVGNIEDEVDNLTEAQVALRSSYGATKIEVRERINSIATKVQSLSNNNGNTKIANNLPLARMLDFVGRDELFGTVEKIFNEDQSQTVAISAFAGSGKSSTALEYGYRQIQTSDKVIRWFNSSSADKIASDYRSLAVALGCDVLKQTPQEIITTVNNKLAHYARELLFIFDNVEAYNDIANYLLNLPKQVKVIITTRSTELDDNIKHVKLEPFDEPEGIIYLQNSLGKNRVSKDKAKVLIDKTGLLPYKLNKAVVYLKSHKLMSIDNYIKEYADKVESELIASIVGGSSQAWEILQYATYLDPDFIPVKIFNALLEINEEQLEEPIKKLESLSLVRIENKDSSLGLRVHRLVQKEVISYSNIHNDQALEKVVLFNRLINNIDDMFPKVDSLPNESWDQARVIQNHAVKVVIEYTEVTKQSSSENTEQNKAASIYDKLGSYYAEVLCNYKQSLEYYKINLKIYQALYPGQNHPDVANFLNNVGYSYSNLGDQRTALKYLEEALLMRQALYPGQNHPSVATSLNNVGSSYSNLGEEQKALKYLEEALLMRKALYPGQNHPDVALSLNNVGYSYSNLGDQRTALKYLEEALWMRKALYPDQNHPSVATSLNNVGSSYGDLGDERAALKYLEEALAMTKALYPDQNHPDVAGSLNNVGSSYGQLGDERAALKYYQEALAMTKALYPDQNHPYIATSLNNVGSSYGDLGDERATLKYLEEALLMRKALYPGQNHPDVAISLNNVGYSYQRLGDKKKAIELKKQAYLIRKEIFGKESKGTKELYEDLANMKIDPDSITKDFVMKRGEVDEVLIDIKEKLQIKVLNKIQELSSKGLGKWSAKFSKAVEDYIKDSYLKKPLGKMANPENLEIAKMLCFEAIALGIANSNKKDTGCAKAFAKQYPELIEKMLNLHPEFFVNELVLKACVSDVSVIADLLGKDANEMIEGKGLVEHSNENIEEAGVANYWNIYTKFAMDNIMQLRLQEELDTENIKVKEDKLITKNIKLLPSFLFSEESTNNESLISRLADALTEDEESNILIPTNLYNKHWIGLMIDKTGCRTGTDIKIEYLDSESSSIPLPLKSLLLEVVNTIYPNCTITISEKEVEQQRYDNCGSSAIENMMNSIFGTNWPQEKIIEHHSMLLAEQLLSEFSL